MASSSLRVAADGFWSEADYFSIRLPAVVVVVR